jgi:hypothetical protein
MTSSMAREIGRAGMSTGFFALSTTHTGGSNRCQEQSVSDPNSTEKMI